MGQENAMVNSVSVSDDTIVPPAHVLPVEPIGYYRQTAHPLLRAVKFLAWFGLILALVGIAEPFLDVSARNRQATALRATPQLSFLFEWQSFLSVARWLRVGLLIVGSVTCLIGWKFGRRCMILYAYVALVTFGLSNVVNLLWMTWMAPRGDVSEYWIQWVTRGFAPALQHLIFPVLVLVVFRDLAVRQYFEQRTVR